MISSQDYKVSFERYCQEITITVKAKQKEGRLVNIETVYNTYNCYKLFVR